MAKPGKNAKLKGQGQPDHSDRNPHIKERPKMPKRTAVTGGKSRKGGSPRGGKRY